MQDTSLGAVGGVTSGLTDQDSTPVAVERLASRPDGSAVGAKAKRAAYP